MNEPNQSVLSISVPEADHILTYVRSQFDGEVPPAGTPAHITLLYPWMPPALIDEDVCAKLKSLFIGFPAFELSLELGWFGREVLLLVPAVPSPLIRLSEAIVSCWPKFPYYAGEFDKIEPHITLAYGDEKRLSSLAESISEQMPILASASFITLCAGQPGQMMDRARFPLRDPDLLANRKLNPSVA